MCLGTPGRIVRYDDHAEQFAIVDFAGTERSVNMSIVVQDDPPPAPGEWVLVHLGMALQRLDPDEAAQSQAFFDEVLAEFEAVAAEREADNQRR